MKSNLFLILCSLMITSLASKNKWTDPSLNTPENNAKVLEEVRNGLHKEHNHHEHDHSHDQEHHEHEHHGHEHHGHEHHGHGHHGHEHHGHEHHEHEHHGHEHHGHEHHGHEHHGHDHHHYEDEYSNKKANNIWLKAFSATALISLAPFLILYLIPIDRKNEAQENFLKVLLAFASGGLLGDAFLHLIPHAISPHSHDGHDHHHHDHHDHHGEHDHHSHVHGPEMEVGMWTLFGLLTFLLIEKFVIAVKGEGHSHSHGPSTPEKSENETSEEKDKESEDSTEEKEEKSEDLTEEKEEKSDKSSDDEDNTELSESHCSGTHQEVKVSAYLNMAADMTHNFTDGLAIGSSFLVSDKMGYITTFLVLVHEIPHEIGDFAILVQSGFTKSNAMNFQLVTALGAFLGTACGLVAESFFASASQFILPFTAGGFIYIATVSVIPELLEGTSSLWQGVKEIAAMSLGIGLMVVIAAYE